MRGHNSHRLQSRLPTWERFKASDVLPVICRKVWFGMMPVALPYFVASDFTQDRRLHPL